VVQWLTAQKRETLLISVVSIGEIERGIAKVRNTDAMFAADLA
jgi:toxin FitB